MAFDPKSTRFPYPEDTDKHYLVVKKDDGTIFDKDYKYIDNSKSFKFKRFWFRVLVFSIGNLIVRIRLGLKVNGKDNLKKYKEEIKKGVVSCCNHVHMWDYLGISCVMGPKHLLHILSWDKNISGENKVFVRLSGGIPIPQNDFRATVAYLKAIRDLLNDGGWLHIYPEGSMWEMYQPIRPFKRGAAYFSVKHKKPILPLAYSYREPGWIRKHIFKQEATLTLNIGELLYPRTDLEQAEAEEELIIRTHSEICKLAGINPEENIYNPIFNNSKRIDYYTTEYGKNYKGSW